MREEGYWKSWLKNAKAIKESLPDDSVQFFAAIEIDFRAFKKFETTDSSETTGKSIDPHEEFKPLEEALKAIGGEFWYFLLDDRRVSVTTENRLRHITMGQNLASEYSIMVGASHMMFVAADTQLPDDVLPKLLELDYSVVSPFISTYGLHGKVYNFAKKQGISYPLPENFQDTPDGCLETFQVEFMEEKQFTSAAAMLIKREIFKKLRWRSDADEGMSDDPAYCHDVRTLLNGHVIQRMDCIATHYPECIPAIENRHPEEALKVVAG